MQLSVPKRSAPSNGAFNSKAANVKQWIDTLPMANIGETTRLLFEAITDLNHQDVPASQRFKALELLHKPVAYVTEHMKKHFVSRPLPLEARNLKIAHLSREITHELATGYKVLVMEQIAGVGRRDKKLLVTAIHRSIKLLNLVLLKAYQVYEAYPDSLWLEVHSLYRYAENNGLHNIKVGQAPGSAHRDSTIADAYKQALLLALACPYRLRHTEAEGVHEALESWAGLCELRLLEDNDEALFAVNLDADQPPSYLVLRENSENRAVCRSLDTRRLAEQVRSALKDKLAASAVSAPNALREGTLRRLMLAWGVMPKRRFSRVRDHSQVVVAMGLSAIHYFVSGEVAFNDAQPGDECTVALGLSREPHLESHAQFAAKAVRNERDTLPDVWEMAYTLEGDAGPSTTEKAVARAAAGVRIDTTHRTQSWKMVNVSAGGYCLLWDNPETTRAQVGELLGLHEAGDPDTFHWRLGVIRWLKSVDKRGLELGVQMLSPGAVGVAAQVETKHRSQANDYTRGLLLPEIASIQQRASLLLPSPPFTVNDTVVVNCHGKDVRVRLTGLVENTGSFAQFQFESLGEIARPATSHKSASKPRPKDFDDVWELL